MNKSFEIKFFNAVDHNELHEVRAMLSTGGDVNTVLVLGGWTALHCSVDRGYKEMVRLLLAFNANVNAKTINGQTSLHIAEMKGYTDIAELLH
ncbi:MAG: ankyrin repeat domain-containing protein [Chlorobium sp.]|jgi:ankyrin repeat protein|nr:ankyrin repeat domain-containing protein [Chlorobium sp.]